MRFDLLELFLIAAVYLLMLFGTARLADLGKLPGRLIQHPLTYVLAFGVYASTWTFYGAFGLAREGGYMYLASYLGVSAAFLLAPLVMIPILRITRTYQLSSLADLFAFRFRSGVAGSLVTALITIAVLPLISTQIQAVVDSVLIINSRIPPHQIGLIYCVMLAVFAVLFGARHASLRNRNTGLVVAMALESLVKLIAMLALAGYALFVVFDGPAGLEAWLTEHPQLISEMHAVPEGNRWRTLLLIFFAAAIAMPHMFHMCFTENASSLSLSRASWGVPLFMLLLAVCVPPILWAGIKLDPGANPEFVILNLGLSVQSDWLMILAFIGGLSAASGVCIVATVAVASMLQNHLVLPLVKVPDNIRFYTWLLWLRRLLIMAVMMASYLFYSAFEQHYELHLLTLIGFVTFLHFLPGILATLFWPSANRWGFLIGLVAGIASWLLTTWSPLLFVSGPDLPAFEMSFGDWQQPTFYSLLINCGLLAFTSVLFPSNQEERRIANACMLNVLPQPLRQDIRISSLEEFQQLLTPRLGAPAARREVMQALEQLGLSAGTLRPLDLLRVRSQLEHNLSALIGPSEVNSLLEPASARGSSDSFRAREVHLLESQLENYHERLSGLAAELDEMRRYHRLTLQKLPIGVCSLDHEGRILFWNHAMEKHTRLNTDEVLGCRLSLLDAPWSGLLGEFAADSVSQSSPQQLIIDGETHWFSLNKAYLNERSDSGMVLLLEDETDAITLADKLAHSERLTSIGRFAAGVAHEIGNPVTGIACLAQNLKLETDNKYILDTGDQIVEQTQRISRIVQSLVRFAHNGTQESSRHEPIRLHDLLAEAVHLVSLDTRGKFQQYHNSIDPAVQILGDAQQLMQVFVNLLNNACDASEENGQIWISSTLRDNRIELSITDEGHGIPPELQARLFEPFFTTKEPGKGTGLGLAMVYNIIEEHYGTIEFISPARQNNQNKGTEVVITLPGLPADISPRPSVTERSTE